MSQSKRTKRGKLMPTAQALLAGKCLITVSQETGLSYYWLRKFQSNQMKDPGVNKVEALYEYLKKEKYVTRQVSK